MQVIGLGTQDDFAYAQEFVASGDLGGPELTFLWDPSFDTWRVFDIRRNSSMTLLRADLEGASEVFFGFSSAEQQAILDALPNFA